MVEEKCIWHRMKVWSHSAEKISIPECCVNYSGWYLVAENVTRWS